MCTDFFPLAGGYDWCIPRCWGWNQIHSTSRTLTLGSFLNNQMRPGRGEKEFRNQETKDLLLIYLQLDGYCSLLSLPVVFSIHIRQYSLILFKYTEATKHRTSFFICPTFSKEHTVCTWPCFVARPYTYPTAISFERHKRIVSFCVGFVSSYNSTTIPI